MKVYLSSTRLDLEEHRAEVAVSLRRTGHTVLQMEEYTAEETAPLDRCVRHVETADVYVGIFAWRYGHVPAANPSLTDLPTGVVSGTTSITEAEYHAAEGKPRLIFMLADTAPWPPTLMDAHTQADRGERIQDLRQLLGEKHTVSFFATPEGLARDVLAAVRGREMVEQLVLQSLDPIDAHQWMMHPDQPEPLGLSDTTLMSIKDQVQEFDDETFMIVDLGVGRNWWSTRLYFLASLLVDLTDVKLLVFVDKEKRFFGASMAVAVRDVLARRLRPLRRYEDVLAERPPLNDLQDELDRRGVAWEHEMMAAGGEASVKTWLRKQELRRFLGDALVQRAVDWSGEGLERGDRVLEVVDQVIKWPQDLVPVTRDGHFYSVVERDAVTEEVAKRFVKDRLGAAS